EVGAAQGPFSTVHSNTFTPTPRPETGLVGEVASARMPDPLTSVHTPVAGPIKALPAMVVEVFGVHRSWSGPASATGLFTSYSTMVTSSKLVLFSHGPLETVQRYTFTPTAIPFTTVEEALAS